MKFSWTSYGSDIFVDMPSTVEETVCRMGCFGLNTCARIKAAMKMAKRTKMIAETMQQMRRLDMVIVLYVKCLGFTEIHRKMDK